MMFDFFSLDILLNVMESSICVAIFTRYAKPRYPKRVSFVLILITIFVSSAKTTLFNFGMIPDFIDTIVSLVIDIGFCWLYFDSSLAVAIFAAACVSPLNMFSNVVVLCLGELFTGMPIAVMIQQEPLFTNLIILSKVMLLVIGLTTAPYIRKLLSFELGRSQWNVVILIITMYQIIMSCFTAFFTSVLTMEDLLIIFLFTLILILLILRIFWEINDLNRSRSDIEIDMQQFLRKKERYQTIEMVHQEATSLRTDLADIKEYLLHPELGGTRSITKLLETTQARLEGNKMAFQTGNRLYDMMLNSRWDVMKKAGINVTTEIYSTELQSCYELDLYTAFCNLLDNAIENCSGQDKRIKIKILSANGFYHLIIKNTISDSVLQNNQHLHTKKEEKQHGFGVLNVKNIAKKYHGGLQYEESQGYFSAHLILEEEQ